MPRCALPCGKCILRSFGNGTLGEAYCSVKPYRYYYRASSAVYHNEVPDVAGAVLLHPIYFHERWKGNKVVKVLTVL